MTGLPGVSSSVLIAVSSEVLVNAEVIILVDVVISGEVILSGEEVISAEVDIAGMLVKYIGLDVPAKEVISAMEGT